MSRKGLLTIALGVVLLIALAIVAQQVITAYRSALASPLALEVQPSPSSMAQANLAVGVTPTAIPQTQTCGRSGTMTILVMVKDEPEFNLWAKQTPPYGVDAIRLVQYNFDTHTVRAIAVPRDLWVSTPHLTGFNLSNSRLGLLFYTVEQGTSGSQTDKAVAGANAVSQTLYDNFGVTPDHYLVIDTSHIAEIVNQIGGVDVYVPYDISYAGYTFYSGPQHLDGSRALAYASILPANEISGGADRFERQNIVLKAIWAKILEPANILKLPGMVDQYKGDLVTDLSPELISNLVCMTDKVPAGQLTMINIDATMFHGAGPDNSIIPDTAAIRAFLQAQLTP